MYENFYTSLLSLELNKLVENVHSIHQMPFKHAKSDGTLGESIPDFYFAITSEGIPNRSLLIADFKKTDFEQALVFSSTSDDESKLITIKIKEAKVSNIKDMKCFLLALTYAFKKLQSYVQSSSFVVEPQRNLKLMYPLNRSNRVFT